MKVGDLVKYTEKTCWGYSVRSSIDIVEWQKKIAGFGIIIATDSGGCDGRASHTVVVWWPKLGESWEPTERIEVISESW